MRTVSIRIAAAAVVVAGALGASLPASAGRILLLDAGNFDNYESSGQRWNADNLYSPGNNTGAVNFSLNWGAGSTTQFTFDPRGQISFGNGNFIAPLLAPTPWVPEQFSGRLRWNSGLVDASLFGATAVVGPFDIANALPAFRFSWEQVCQVSCDNAAQVTFQAILIGRGGGNFDLEFNYGSNSGLPSGLTAGYQLGSNAATFAGPYSVIGPDYCFRGGVSTSCSGVSAIPEPSTYAGIAVGLAALAAWRRRAARGHASLPAAA